MKLLWARKVWISDQLRQAQRSSMLRLEQALRYHLWMLARSSTIRLARSRHWEARKAQLRFQVTFLPLVSVLETTKLLKFFLRIKVDQTSKKRETSMMRKTLTSLLKLKLLQSWPLKQSLMRARWRPSEKLVSPSCQWSQSRTLLHHMLRASQTLDARRSCPMWTRTAPYLLLSIQIAKLQALLKMAVLLLKTESQQKRLLQGPMKSKVRLQLQLSKDWWWPPRKWWWRNRQRRKIASTSCM